MEYEEVKSRPPSYLRALRQAHGQKLGDVSRTLRERYSIEMSDAYLSQLELQRALNPSVKIVYALAMHYKEDLAKLVQYFVNVHGEVKAIEEENERGD